ncbi:MAG: O-antigen ligase family protein [Candidatus Brocadiia bacterium]|nr:O-antigen ligase family protein [Candidatus Brocadiia bacterium]
MTEGEGKTPLIGWLTCGLLLAAAGAMLATGEYLPIALKPLFPTYLKLFAAQSLAVPAAIAGAMWLAGRRRAAQHERGGVDGAGIDWAKAAFPLALALYAGWELLSCLWAPWRFGAVGYAIREMWMFALCFGCFAAFRPRRRWLAFALIFALAASAAATWQIIELALMPDPTVATKQLAKRFLARPMLYGNPNFSCAQAICGGLIAVGLGLWAAARIRGGDALAGGKKWWLFAGIGACVLAVAVSLWLLLLSRSLAGRLALAAAGAAYALCILPLGRRRRRVVLGLALLAVLALSISWRGIAARMEAPASEFYARGSVWWPATYDMFTEKPLRGWGVGAYASAYYRHAPPGADLAKSTRANVQATHPHNEFLRVAAEQGLIGLVFYLAVLGIPLAAAYRRLRRLDFGARAVGFAMWAGTVAYVVQSALGKAAMTWDFAMPYWMLLGVLASASQSPPARADAPRAAWRPTWRVWAAGASVALVALLVWSSWGLRSYRSMLYLTDVDRVRFKLLQTRGGSYDGKTIEEHLLKARVGSLWPTRVLDREYKSARALQQVGHYERALSMLRQVQEQAPGAIETEWRIGQCYVAMGVLEKRAGGAERLAELGAEAIKWLSSHIRWHPTATSAYIDLATVDLDEATRLLLEQVLVRDKRPDAGRVNLLGRFFAYRNNWPAVEHLMEQLEQAKPEDVDIVSAALVPLLAPHYEKSAQRAKLEELRRRYPEAIRQWERERKREGEP